MEKKCCKCKEIKNILEFNKCKKNNTGLQGYCKSCNKETSKLFREANVDKIKKYSRNYYKSNTGYFLYYIFDYKNKNCVYVGSCSSLNRLNSHVNLHSNIKDFMQKGTWVSIKCVPLHNYGITTREERLYCEAIAIQMLNAELNVVEPNINIESTRAIELYDIIDSFFKSPDDYFVTYKVNRSFYNSYFINSYSRISNNI